VTNIHTSDELKLSGNCLKFSRPLLSFDQGFEGSVHLQLIKELLVQMFNTPKNHPKSKPFIDHVLSFKLHDNRIWFRAYQVLNQHEEKFTAKDDVEKLVLIEIGPRMTLQPIKIFEGSIGGAALWQNKAFIAPSKQRGKNFAEYLRKRDKKAIRKSEKKQLIKEGKDDDSYLSDAFE
jgi:ribosome biogenesis protein BRX1